MSDSQEIKRKKTYTIGISDITGIFLSSIIPLTLTLPVTSKLLDGNFGNISSAITKEYSPFVIAIILYLLSITMALSYGFLRYVFLSIVPSSLNNNIEIFRQEIDKIYRYNNDIKVKNAAYYLSNSHSKRSFIENRKDISILLIEFFLTDVRSAFQFITNSHDIRVSVYHESTDSTELRAVATTEFNRPISTMPSFKIYNKIGDGHKERKLFSKRLRWFFEYFNPFRPFDDAVRYEGYCGYCFHKKIPISGNGSILDINRKHYISTREGKYDRSILCFPITYSMKSIVISVDSSYKKDFHLTKNDTILIYNILKQIQDNFILYYDLIIHQGVKERTVT